MKMRVPGTLRKGEIKRMEQLVRKAKNHNKEAFEDLMQAQAQSMYKVAKAILKNDEDVLDAMQETALTCWEKIGTLKQERYFKTWLTRILINHCNEICRQRKYTVSEEMISETGRQEESFLNVEWDDFLNCLDVKHRTVIILYYVQGFKTREVAEILKVNESTVRSRLAVAREKMEQLYEKSSAAGRKFARRSIG